MRELILGIPLSLKFFKHDLCLKSGITLFRSPVGNNDVPYPFAMDDEYVYLLIEDTCIAKTHIDLAQKPFDPYATKYNSGSKIVSEKLAKTVVIPRQ